MTKHGGFLLYCFNLPCVIIMIFGCIVEMTARKEKIQVIMYACVVFVSDDEILTAPRDCFTGL